MLPAKFEKSPYFLNTPRIYDIFLKNKNNKEIRGPKGDGDMPVAKRD